MTRLGKYRRYAAVLAALTVSLTGLWYIGVLTAVLFAPGSTAVSPAALGLGPAPVLTTVHQTYTRPAAIPVLVYHQLDNGCAPTAAICNVKEPETSSERQFAGQMQWLYDNGYRTVTPQQYTAWLQDKKVALPAKPVLITVDNGISNFYDAGTAVLQRYGFSATAMVVTGFADGASGQCTNPADQPGCPTANQNWDATWAQLEGLPSPTWNFALEAGPSGHYVQDYSTTCPAFLACMKPGETVAAYEQRVKAELNTGEAELRQHLGSRFDPSVWTVPYSDLGYPQCPQSSCTPQQSTGPPGWLSAYAESRFSAVFVEDADRNGVQNERFRLDVQGWMTLGEFADLFGAD